MIKWHIKWNDGLLDGFWSHLHYAILTKWRFKQCDCLYNDGLSGFACLAWKSWTEQKWKRMNELTQQWSWSCDDDNCPWMVYISSFKWIGKNINQLQYIWVWKQRWEFFVRRLSRCLFHSRLLLFHINRVTLLCVIIHNILKSPCVLHWSVFLPSCFLSPLLKLH